MIIGVFIFFEGLLVYSWLLMYCDVNYETNSHIHRHHPQLRTNPKNCSGANTLLTPQLYFISFSFRQFRVSLFNQNGLKDYWLDLRYILFQRKLEYQGSSRSPSYILTINCFLILIIILFFVKKKIIFFLKIIVSFYFQLLHP